MFVFRLSQVTFTILICWSFVFSQKPELIIQNGHAAEILSVSISPNGKLLASGDSNTIVLWDLESSKLLKTLTAPQTGVLSLSFTPDGKILASGGFDSTIILWEVSTGKPLKRLAKHIDSINSLSFSPDGKLLASASKDATIKLWNTATGDEVLNITETDYIDLVSFSPDGTMLASCNGTRDSESEKGKEYFIKIRNSSTGQIIKEIRGFTEEQKALFSDSEKLIIQDSSNIQCLKISDGSVIYNLKLKSAVSTFDLSSDRKTAVLGDWKGRITLLNTSDGTIITEFEAENNDIINRVQISSAGKILISVSMKKLKIWDWQSGKLKNDLTAKAGYLSSLGLSRENSMLAISDYDKSVELWNLVDGERRNLFFDRNSDGLDAVAVSSKRNLVASGGWNYVRLWNLLTGEEIMMLRQDIVTDENTSIMTKVSALDFSPKEDILASTWGDTVQIWDVVTGERLKVLTGNSPVKGKTVAFSPTGKLLATGGSDGKIKIWNLDSQKMIFDISAHLQDVISSVAFSPDEKSLASLGLNEKNIKLWNLETGKEKFYQAVPDWVKFLGSSAFARVGNRRLQFIIEGSAVSFLNFETGEKIGTLIILSGGNWLFSTPGGFFDGTTEAQKELLWRFTENLTDTAPVESFYYEFYYPGLLKKTLAGEVPQLPDKTIPFDRKDIRQADIRMCRKCPCYQEKQVINGGVKNDRAETQLCIDVTIPADFVLNDFPNSKEVAIRLVKDQHPITKFIFESFLPDNQIALKSLVAALAKNPRTEPNFDLQQLLRREFNQLIKQPDFARKCADFSTFSADEINKLCNSEPEGVDRYWLSRMMIENLFLDGIKQGGIRNLENPSGKKLTAAEMETDRNGVCPAAEMCLQDMRLFWNGRLIQRWRGDILQSCEKVSRYRAQCHTRIPQVKSIENRYSAYLFNQHRVKSRDAVFILNEF